MNKVDSTKNDLVELNEQFHNKSLVVKSFYMQLMQAGIAYKKSILISLTPDGSNTFFGKLIRQDGKIIEFDIDLDLADQSIWSDITDDFLSGIRKCYKLKPWSREIVAYDMYKKLEQSGSEHRFC